jgi:hypothetical protein
MVMPILIMETLGKITFKEVQMYQHMTIYAQKAMPYLSRFKR